MKVFEKLVSMNCQPWLTTKTLSLDLKKVGKKADEDEISSIKEIENLFSIRNRL